MSDEFYIKLGEMSDQICKDFTDDPDCGDDRFRLAVYREKYIDLNFPWLYIHFTYEGLMTLNVLKAIERRYIDFCALEGGSLETLHLSRRGPGFMVRLVYVPSTARPTEPDEANSSGTSPKPASEQ